MCSPELVPSGRPSPAQLLWLAVCFPVVQTASNPQGAQSWANTEGQNFVADHASPDIDFTSMHLWVNNGGVRRGGAGQARARAPFWMRHACQPLQQIS